MKMRLIIGKEHETEAHGTTEHSDENGAFWAKVENYPKEAFEQYVIPSRKGEVTVVINNLTYKMTELTADGKFRAVPDFQGD